MFKFLKDKIKSAVSRISEKIEAEGKSIMFSGDLGNYPAPIIHNTEHLPEVDYCVIESTYGARVHEDTSAREGELEDVIEDTAKRGGVLMIPAFAMERTQELLYHIDALMRHGRVPGIPVFMDSPLAIKLTAVYKKYEKYFNPETFDLVRSGEDIMNFPGLKMTLTVEQSKEINNVPSPKIIIAGSGMSNGGRIIHHERRYLSDPKNTLLLVGYQSAGSLGRILQDGAKSITILGDKIEVRAKIEVIRGYSAHPDQEGLVEFVQKSAETLKQVFVVQGESSSSLFFVQRVRDYLGLNAQSPKYGDSIQLL